LLFIVSRLLTPVLVFLAALVPQASSLEDLHLKNDLASELYSVSAFAHGHRHGYEDGFRRADHEYHFGYQARPLKLKDVPKPTGYEKGFGDKDLFRKGFRYGFMAGYSDSFAGRSFRVPKWMKAVPPFRNAQTLPEAEEARQSDKQVRKVFEEGMLKGYQLGLSSEMQNLLPEFLADQAERFCVQEAKAGENGYCDGYTQGFVIGVGDRSSFSDSDRIEVAKNAAKH
jgi:hypothetical protein